MISNDTTFSLHPSASSGRPSSYSDQVYGQILENIVSGDFNEGSKLPAEKELCQRFGVSRPVVRQALSRLRLDGLVEARRGSGTYVISRPSDELNKFTDLTKVSKVLRYLELRLSVEGGAAALAAQRRSSDAMEAIVRAHEAFNKQVSAGVFLPAADRDLHMAISAATGNEFFAKALESAEMSLAEFMGVSLSLTKSGSAERAKSVMQEHANIVEAIRVQDSIEARAAMEFHILQAKRRLTDRSFEP